MTLDEQLTSVQAAIASIEATGQSYTIQSRSFTRADLRTLYQRERELKNAIARAARGGLRVSYGMPSP